MQNETEKKAYALGIIGRENHVNFDSDIDPDKLSYLNSLAEDAILDEPKTEDGKKMKILIEQEMAVSDGEYNKTFNFHKDLNNNKIAPGSVFVLELLAKYAQQLNDADEKLYDKLLSEIIIKFNELELPVGYSEKPFVMAMGHVKKLFTLLEGQVGIRELELRSLATGVHHPKFGLSPHLASFKKLDEAIIKLREITGFTGEDFRGK